MKTATRAVAVDERSTRRMAGMAAICGMAAALVGCATAGPEAAGNPVAAERTVGDLRAQNAGYVRQIEELQNRTFILENKLDSRRVADEKKAPAPYKRIAPATIKAPVSELPLSEEPSDVEYVGAAAIPLKRGHKVLRLSGSGEVARASMVRERSSLPFDASEPPERITTVALRLYRRSLGALKVGHHAVAMKGFHHFLARYSRNQYADNAQYWLAECYYDLKQYHAATREFRRVVERYPHGNKVPDAMLKAGYSRLALGERSEGLRELESLRKSYPKNAAAHLAVLRLAQEGDAGATAPKLAAAPNASLPHVAEAR